MPKKTSNNLSDEQKKELNLDQKIDQLIEKEISADLTEKVDAEIERQVKEKVGEKLENKIGKKIELILPEKGEVQAEPPTPARNILLSVITEFKTSFFICWKGACRNISIVMLVSYIAIISLLIICNATNSCQNSWLLAAIIGITVLMSIVSLFLSIVSRYPRTAMIFWILLDIPLFLLIIFLATKLIGLAIIGLVLLVRLIQLYSGRD